MEELLRQGRLASIFSRRFCGHLINGLSRCLHCLTPIRYAAFPPTVPERGSLMGKRGKDGVRYAKQEARAGKWTVMEFGASQLYTLFFVWVVVLFVARCALPDVGGLGV